MFQTFNGRGLQLEGTDGDARPAEVVQASPPGEEQGDDDQDQGEADTALGGAGHAVFSGWRHWCSLRGSAPDGAPLPR